MKHKLTLLILSCMALLASCSKGGDEAVQKKLGVSPSTISFTAADATPRQLTVTAENTDWTFSVEEAWVTVDRNDSTLTVSVAENTSEDARETTITVTATDSGVNPVAVKVKQSGVESLPTDTPVLQVSATELYFTSTDAPAQELTITVNGGVEWDFVADHDWVSLSKKDDNTLVVEVANNEISKQRDSGFSIYNTNTDVKVSSLRVKIVQEAKDVEGSITVLNLPENNTIIFKHYEGNIYEATSPNIQIELEPITATYTIEILTENPWCEINYIGTNGEKPIISGKRTGGTTAEADAEIVIHHSDPNVKPVSITLHKNEMTTRMFETELTHDVDLQATQATGRIYTYGGSLKRGYSIIDVAFYSDGVTYYIDGKNVSLDDDVFGKAISVNYEGVGELVTMRLYDEEDIKDKDISQRTFTISSEEIAPGKAAPGELFAMNSKYQISNCGYAEIDGDILKDAADALATGGTVTVTKDGDNYTFEWEFSTTNDCTITGKYTGPIEFERKHSEFNFGIGDGNGDNMGKQ